jgi:NAD(P)-dependent dehydrogenase (short-subunit alcohol dehydrogenase family)
MTEIALVTGANRGLGFETARRLAQSGVRTIVAARDARRGADAADALRHDGLDVESIVLDVDLPTSVHAAAQHVNDQHGRLDILINNAGVLPEATASDDADPLDLALFRATYETNVFGAIAVIQEFLPLLRKSQRGRIVNVSTTMGSLTDHSDPSSPYYELAVPAYRSSKTALNSVTVTLSKLLKDTAIKVNAVCPGWVQTDLAPGNREHAPTPAAEAAEIVVDMARLPDDGPTGQFVDRAGTVPW